MGSSSTTTTTTANDQEPSMQRISKHLPTVIRTSPTTTYTTTRNMSLFPRFVENEFAPMFRLLDSYANHAVNNGRTNNGPFISGFGGSRRLHAKVRHQGDRSDLRAPWRAARHRAEEHQHRVHRPPNRDHQGSYRAQSRRRAASCSPHRGRATRTDRRR